MAIAVIIAGGLALSGVLLSGAATLDQAEEATNSVTKLALVAGGVYALYLFYGRRRQ